MKICCFTREMKSLLKNEVDKITTQTSWLGQFINLMNVAETCQELHQKGIVRPGSYPIDLDGKDFKMMNRLLLSVTVEKLS